MTARPPEGVFWYHIIYVVTPRSTFSQRLFLSIARVIYSLTLLRGGINNRIKNWISFIRPDGVYIHFHLRRPDCRYEVETIAIFLERCQVVVCEYYMGSKDIWRCVMGLSVPMLELFTFFKDVVCIFYRYVCKYTRFSFWMLIDW